MSAYNAADTIEKAITSVLNQTHKDIELIIVEDCSSDKTLEIISTFKDNRVKVIKHKENLGAGWSRYDGIKASTGGYTTFLDSDDWLDKDCIETLLANAIQTGADMVSPGYIAHFENSEVPLIPKRCVLMNEAKYHQDEADCLRFLNVALIKQTLWDKVEYCKRRFVEDSPTLIKLIYYANKRSILDYAGYHYIQRNSSLVHSASQYKYWIFETLCAIDAYNFMHKHGENTMDLRLVFSKFANFPIKHSMEEEKLFKEELNEIKEFINNNI